MITRSSLLLRLRLTRSEFARDDRRELVIKKPHGVRFVNKNQMTGLLVPPGDSDALAAALQRLLGDERLRQTLGNAAKRRAELEFSSDRMVRRVQQVYEEVLGGRR